MVLKKLALAAAFAVAPFVVLAEDTSQSSAFVAREGGFIHSDCIGESEAGVVCQALFPETNVNSGEVVLGHSLPTLIPLNDGFEQFVDAEGNVTTLVVVRVS